MRRDQSELHMRVAEGLHEVMRGLADLGFGLLHAENVAHRTVDPRPAIGRPRPDAFVEAGEHRHIRADQARFEKAQNGERGGIVLAAAHGQPMQPVADDGGRARQVAGAEEAGFLAAGGRRRRAAPRRPRPARRPRPRWPRRLRRADRDVRRGCWAGSRGAVQHAGDAARMGDGLFPLLRGDGAKQKMCGALLLFFRRKAQRMGEPADLRGSRSRSGAARSRSGSHGGAPPRPEAEESEVMAEQGGKRFGREVLQQTFEQQVQERGAGMAHQRLASRIVDRDVPAPELRLHAAGKLAVRRDEAAGAARRFEAFAQHEGGHHRLFLDGTRLDEFHALHGGVRLAPPGP